MALWFWDLFHSIWREPQRAALRNVDAADVVNFKMGKRSLTYTEVGMFLFVLGDLSLTTSLEDGSRKN